MKITYLGHSSFLVSDGTVTVAIDPFLTGNPRAVMSADEISCDWVVLTHGHGDHIGDAIPIAKRCNATVTAPNELAIYMGQNGVESVEPMNPGGELTTPFGSVAYTHAIHSSSYDGQYMGVACGVVVRLGDKAFYHAGDTTLFSDMRLIGEIYRPDVVALPVGDRFTMGPALAARAAELIGAPVAIPIHYKTFPLLVQSIDGFAPAGVTVRELEPGESYQV